MRQKTFLILLSFVLFLAGNALFAEETNTSVAISRGIGMSADAALKDAFVQAVQQVVGVLMNAETMVENDKVIKDNVLTYSDGFITKYDVLKPAAQNQAGLFEITIRATVEQKKLRKKLEESKILRNEVKGMENVWAQMVTKEIRKEDSEQILMNALDLLKPVDFLLPTFVDEQGRTGSEAQLTAIPQKDGNTVTVRIGVAITFDHKKYVDEVLPYLYDVLDKTCLHKSDEIVVSPSNKFNKRNYDLCFYVEKNIIEEKERFEVRCLPTVNQEYTVVKKISRAEHFRPEPSVPMNPNEIVIFLNVSKRYNPSMQKFVAFAFPQTRTLDSYFAKLYKKINCVLSLKDKDGNDIVISTEECNRALLAHDNRTISPEFMIYGGYYCNSDGTVFSLDMDKEDLKDVKSMEVKFETK
ncbi:MAG: hypothetical protein IKP00_01555 [Victivallales bacterium]|nr:hypothetical protein [Victivallales bacterium]